MNWGNQEEKLNAGRGRGEGGVSEGTDAIPFHSLGSGCQADNGAHRAVQALVPVIRVRRWPERQMTACGVRDTARVQALR